MQGRRLHKGWHSTMPHDPHDQGHAHLCPRQPALAPRIATSCLELTLPIPSLYCWRALNLTIRLMCMAHLSGLDNLGKAVGHEIRERALAELAAVAGSDYSDMVSPTQIHPGDCDTYEWSIYWLDREGIGWCGGPLQRGSSAVRYTLYIRSGDTGHTPTHPPVANVAFYVPICADTCA